MASSLEWTARTRRQEERFPLRGAACIIEPNEFDRECIGMLLRGMGFATHETGAGAAGEFITGQIHIAVAVVNTSLPDVPGLALVRRLRLQTPEAVIIALSPDMNSGVPEALARFAGADAVLAAPPCSEALCAAITQALEMPHRALNPAFAREASVSA